MTAAEYTTALSSLGMDNKVAAEWLGIGLRTQQRYAKSGPCGMASRAVRTEIELRSVVQPMFNSIVDAIQSGEM